MEIIKLLLKGMVVGLANIIPGVSGGTLMVSMNIYEKLIESITGFFTNIKKSLGFLVPLFIGIGIAIIGSSFGIEALFANYPIQTNLLFIGLILGGLPMAFKNVKGKSIKAGHILSFAIFFIIVVGLAAVGSGNGGDVALSTNFGGMIILFFVGVIASATMVIPGISGSMILLLLGFYNPVIESITVFLRALTSGDSEGIAYGIKVLVPFGLGVVVGIFAIAKLIQIIFDKFPMYAHWAIIGLIVSSPVAIILINNLSGFNVVNILTGIVALFVGIVISMKLGE